MNVAYITTAERIGIGKGIHRRDAKKDDRKDFRAGYR